MVPKPACDLHVLSSHLLVDVEDPGWGSMALQDSGAHGKEPGCPNDFVEQNISYP